MQGRPRKKEKQTEGIYSRYTEKERKHFEKKMKETDEKYIGTYVRLAALKGSEYKI